MNYLDEIKNKILCADSLSVMKQLPDKCIDWIITDPPYGENIGKMGFTNSKHPMDHGGLAKRTLYKNHNTSWDEFIPSKEYFDEMFRISKNQIIFGGNFFLEHLPITRCWIIWDKKVEDKYTNDFGDCELAWCSLNKPPKIIRWLWHGMIQQDMKHKEKRYHPTQKPVGMLVKLMNRLKISNSLILDPFSGVGSVALASMQINNEYICIEALQEYCEIAKKRVEDEYSRLSG